jgi:hypothetical protein
MTENKLCCYICNKTYLKKSSLDKHKLLCEFKTKTMREREVELEELGDMPTYAELVKIVQELSTKLVKMEAKVDGMQKYIDRKRKKVNVVTWLNTTIIPTIGYLEWINEYIVITQQHFEYLLENTIFDTMNRIFEGILYERDDFVYPIKCFDQKPGIFYICEKKEDGNPEWKQLETNELSMLFKKIQNNMIRELTNWKEQNKNNFDDKMSILFNKSVIKLMNISLSQDATFSKMKSNLYNYLKTDLRIVEIE